MKSIVVAIYTHPELYPPVLNSIDELSKAYDEVIVLSRNLNLNHWNYPPNVKLVSIGRYIQIMESELKGTLWKIRSFLQFTGKLFELLKQHKPGWIMCNDPISLMSFRRIRPFLKRQIKLWYHNHDVTELEMVRKFSIGYFAVKSERNSFHEIDLFTLPAESRSNFFPIDRLKGEWMVIPNYPSKGRNSSVTHRILETVGALRLLYQGRISNEHGLEEILEFVRSDSSVRLTIIGPGDEKYIRALENKISTLQVNNQVDLLNPVAYGVLQKITQNHHVGLAVNKPMNTLYSTAAQASNKIYEYAAAGLPVIYFQDSHYIKYLGKFNWAFPSDLSQNSLGDVLKKIRSEYELITRSAKNDFYNYLNFEVVFKRVLDFLSGKAVQKP